MNATVAREITEKAVNDKINSELESLYRRIDENASYGEGQVHLLHNEGSPMGEALRVILEEEGFTIEANSNQELIVKW